MKKMTKTHFYTNNTVVWAPFAHKRSRITTESSQRNNSRVEIFALFVMVPSFLVKFMQNFRTRKKKENSCIMTKQKRLSTWRWDFPHYVIIGGAGWPPWIHRPLECIKIRKSKNCIWELRLKKWSIPISVDFFCKEINFWRFLNSIYLKYQLYAD